MLWWFLALACTSTPPDPLGEKGRTARAALQEALQARDPSIVGAAAREASAWEGKDPALDRLLGDALANVLMKPDEGLDLLKANPAPEDEAWTRALRGAAMRSGTPAAITEAWSVSGRPAIAATHPVVQQVAQRARQDPAKGPELLEDVVGRCALLDRQPSVGRKALDLPATPDLIPAARALGAVEVAMGRASRRTDPDPVTGAGPWQCVRRTLLDTSWPEPMLRSVVIGAGDGQTTVFIDIKLEDGHPWAYAASHAAYGARWVRAATIYRDAGGGEVGAARVREVLGTGLRGK